MERYSQRTGLIDTENAFKVGPYIAHVEKDGHSVVKCNLGEPDFPLPAHIREEVKRQLDNDLTHYVDPQGIIGLREAVAKDVGDRRGLEITPDRVVIFPSTRATFYNRTNVPSVADQRVEFEIAVNIET